MNIFVLSVHFKVNPRTICSLCFPSQLSRQPAPLIFSTTQAIFPSGKLCCLPFFKGKHRLFYMYVSKRLLAKIVYKNFRIENTLSVESEHFIASISFWQWSVQCEWKIHISWFPPKSVYQSRSLLILSSMLQRVLLWLMVNERLSLTEW